MILPKLAQFAHFYPEGVLEVTSSNDPVDLVAGEYDAGVQRFAEVACLSARQFGRVFKAETGETPAKAVERLRAEVARERIESDAEPVESIAAAVGFSDPERMRRAFLRLYGEPPQSLRRKACH